MEVGHGSWSAGLASRRHLIRVPREDLNHVEGIAISRVSINASCASIYQAFAYPGMP